MLITLYRLIIPSIVIAILIIAFKVITIFVVPPIDLVPQGQTIVVLRIWNDETDELFPKFLDNTDNLCERHANEEIFNKLRLPEIEKTLCRGIILIALTKSTLLFRFPYSQNLYNYSSQY